MITYSDSPHTVDLGNYYAILPPSDEAVIKAFLAKTNSQFVPTGFNYSSGSNSNFLTVDEIRDLIRTNIDPEFRPL